MALQNHPVTLPVGANAEPDTCGSCKFFEREEYTHGYGYCRIVMPPHKERFALKPYRDGDEERGPNFVKDSQRCDLQRSDGKVYIVQRRIPPSN